MPGEAPTTTTTTTTTIVVTVPPPAKTKKAAARRKEAYQQQVAGWRQNKCLLVLGGMGFKAATDEFERDCRAKLAHDNPGAVVQFAWMPHKKATRDHQGKVAVGFESAAQRVAAERALAHWVWRIHPIHMEGVNMKKYPKKLAVIKTAPQYPTNVSLLPTAGAARLQHGEPAANQTSSRPLKTRVLRIITNPPAPVTIDLTGASSPEPARPTTPVNVPCATAATVHEAAVLAHEASVTAHWAVIDAREATYRAFAAEAEGDAAAAEAAKQAAAAADERLRVAYGAAATASRIAAAYSASISLRGTVYRY